MPPAAPPPKVGDGDAPPHDPPHARPSDHGLTNGLAAASTAQSNGLQLDRGLPASAASSGRRMILECHDGSTWSGTSFGAETSIAGELVFSTGMGYPESITDPSYRGQILILTYPLVGNWGAPSRETRDPLIPSIPAHFESSQIHVAGLIVATYAGEDYSHYLAQSSLGTWLKEQGVPALHGVDTRALTKKIRTGGTLLGRLLLEESGAAGLLHEDSQDTAYGEPQPQFKYPSVPWRNQNEFNLVAEVSCRTPYVCSPPQSALKHPSGRNLRVLCVDVGLKYNQLRCLVSRGVEVQVVPWDYDFTATSEGDYDGLFISNGPGDPAMLETTVKHLRHAINAARTPIFGICLGHQLLGRAAGAQTRHMLWGNRGQNIPCTETTSSKPRTYITSQNHGFEVDANTLPADWEPLFKNANDGSNEGIRHTSKPFFSVQFHPESAPGPRDTEFLFDVFISAVQKSTEDRTSLESRLRLPGELEALWDVPSRVKVHKVLILGSGGLSIGQAGEFDYSGSQCIKALKQEGIYTILLNPNIATIQTSKGLADKVYFLPVTADSVRKIFEYERPDGIYVTFGGQTALGVGIELKDEFESWGVQVLGTPISSIITTEDRELFARSMESIGEKCAESASATTVEEAQVAAARIGFPVIIRAAFALGGLGSGFADNEEQLLDMCQKAFAASPQVLIERSMKGWKEIEYEVMRDSYDNCITVCNMENFDPLGIHTGDSIVIAPSQTLSDQDYNMLRTTALNTIRHLGIVGGCNIQYALNPFSKEFYIIEVNARLSRSSALASKATGFAIGYTAALVGLGISLHDITNGVTKKTCACFEPALDYVVAKIPRWDLKKFTRVSTTLSSSMKSVGEVMSIGRTFEEAIQKAIRCVDYHNLGFNETNALMSIDTELQTPSDQRMFAIANAMHAGYSVDKIWELTKIDRWFLSRLKGLSDFAKYMSTCRPAQVSTSMIRRAKQLGFSDRQLAHFWGSTELAVRDLRLRAKITPFVKQIDTVAAEFPALTNYCYLTYNASEGDVDFEDHGMMVLGSGVYRVGSSVEFDWCAVSAIQTLRELKYQTICLNNNPETVSTDYDQVDRLYFEVTNLETVLDIYQMERPEGVVLSMGGQAPNNLAVSLDRLGVRILGTSAAMIDTAENRYKFSRLLDQIRVDQPAWKELTSFKEAIAFCNKVSYPVLVRPSYVLSGAAMNTVYSQDDLENYLQQATDVSRDHPVVITKYIENAKEIEMDAVAYNGKLLCHFISEHVENAGVHSGDATLILPPQDLDPETVRRIEEATQKIGNSLNVTGPFNIQFIAKDNEIKVIECNVRASRSFPFCSKVTSVNLVELAVKAMIDAPESGYARANVALNYVGIKTPQFSFSRLSGADPVLGVEMASTGEVACFGRDKYEAYLKSLLATGFKLPKKNILLSIGSYKEKAEMLPSIKKLHTLGYCLFATSGTADFIQEHGIPVKYLESLSSQIEDQKAEYSLMQHLPTIDLYINLPSNNRFRRPANYLSTGYRTRRLAVDFQIPLVTNVKNAKILIEAIARRYTELKLSPIDYQTSCKTINVPGLINIGAFVPGIVAPGNHDFEEVTKASAAAGFTMIRIMPLGVDGSISDAHTLQVALNNCRHKAYCDFNLSIAATSTNTESLARLTDQVGSLFLPFHHFSGNMGKLDAITAHFEAWPKTKPLITDAKATALATILLLAALHNRKVHVTSVTTAEDIRVIALSKQKGLAVTCDVSVYALFFSQADYPQCAFLPTARDQQVLWEHMASIDMFSVGSIPYRLALALATTPDASPGVGIADTVPLLFTAISEGRLTVEGFVDRMYHNPKQIFDLHDQAGTSIEIEVDRPYVVQKSRAWSPLVGRTVQGSVSRVVLNGATIGLDQVLLPGLPGGQDMSTHEPTAGVGSSVKSPTLPPEPDSPFMERRGSTTLTRQDSMLEAPKAVAASQAAHQPEPSMPRALPVSTMGPSVPNHAAFKNRHIISVNDFGREDLHVLFKLAGEMRLAVERYGVLDVLRGKVLCTLFYEASTRTSASFAVAMERLGGRVVAVTSDTASTQKGESLADTVRTMGCYADAIVLRHPDVASAATAAQYAPVPILNGGNGSREHPSQAMLDLFTIREELSSINNLCITFVGDLRYGRTVHSLIQLLQHYEGVSVVLVSHPSLALPPDLRDALVARGQLVREAEALDDAIVADSDVLYVTRVQKERFPSPAEYERVKDHLKLDNRTLRAAKSQAIVMHPLPRSGEIDPDMDVNPAAAYFRQMKYGLYCRMALLALVMA